MLYELKRTFGVAPIDLSDALFVIDTDIYAGADGVSYTPATAGVLDYESENQHFPAENTLEIYGWETADSALDTAGLAVTLQSSEDGESWKDEFLLNFTQAVIVADRLIYRSTIPAHTGQKVRLKLTVGTEVFTAGKVLAAVRPL